MIEFIGEVGKLIGGLIGAILNIPMSNNENAITFGVVLIIVIIVTIALKFFFGGRGD